MGQMYYAAMIVVVASEMTFELPPSLTGILSSIVLLLDAIVLPHAMGDNAVSCTLASCVRLRVLCVLG